MPRAASRKRIFSVFQPGVNGANSARSIWPKVCVIGPVSVRTYQANDGTTRASLEVTADDVEFLSSRNDAEAAGGYTAPAAEAPSAETPAAGFTAVETDELPF